VTNGGGATVGGLTTVGVAGGAADRPAEGVAAALGLGVVVAPPGAVWPRLSELGVPLHLTSAQLTVR